MYACGENKHNVYTRKSLLWNTRIYRSHDLAFTRATSSSRIFFSSSASSLVLSVFFWLVYVSFDVLTTFHALQMPKEATQTKVSVVRLTHGPANPFSVPLVLYSYYR